ncbi:hypothetical protein BG011_001101 [Mortierella polycephala]|uniref:INO80 complex subunit E N-terminal domain-containing protein n=1 Tax=Mortierella polycephala TaxID=41804 RepID=A0A9P6U682_9FUNG|nr:hypothetical protein BG011_001101 [Mortierella polycephala]
MVKEKEAATYQESSHMNATVEVQQNAAEPKARSLSSTDDNSMVITSESDQMKSFPPPDDLTQNLKNENALEQNGSPLHSLEDQGFKRGHGHDKESGQIDIHHHGNMDESPAPQHAKGMETDHEARHPSDDKYRRLKRKLKQVLEENERLSIELDRSSRRARTLRSEKNLLLDRLCVYERDSDSSPDTLSSLSSDSELSDAPLDHHHHSRSRRASPEQATTVSHSSKKNRASGNSNNSNKEPELVSSSSYHHPKKSTSKAAGRKSPAAVVRKEGKAVAPAPTPVASTITTVGSATQKPKRITNSLKQRTHSTKARKVQALEKDEAGKVKLPVTVGIITIMDLGHVVYDREAFHNERYIWPVGYKMSRLYNSMIDPQKQTTYTCSIVDDGDAPKFQIDAEDQPGLPIIAGTATGAWTHVVKAANLIRKRDHSNSASGPDYFGFSNATIAKMIQDLPNAEKCENYIMQRFEEPSTKTPFITPEKRKISALNSLTSGKEDAGEDEEDQEEGIGAEEEEDDNAYRSLGNSEKTTEHTLSSTVRRASFGLDTKAIDDQVGEGGDQEDVKMAEELEEEEVYELEEEEEEEEDTHPEKNTSIDAAKEQSQGQEVGDLAAPDDALLPMTTRDKPAEDEKQELSESEMIDI